MNQHLTASETSVELSRMIYRVARDCKNINEVFEHFLDCNHAPDISDRQLKAVITHVVNNTNMFGEARYTQQDLLDVVEANVGLADVLKSKVGSASNIMLFDVSNIDVRKAFADAVSINSDDEYDDTIKYDYIITENNDGEVYEFAWDRSTILEITTYKMIPDVEDVKSISIIGDKVIVEQNGYGYCSDEDGFSIYFGKQYVWNAHWLELPKGEINATSLALANKGNFNR